MPPLTTIARHCAAAAVLAMAAAPVAAQFSMVPQPLCKEVRESTQEVEREYRIDAARHLYGCYPMRVMRGKMPPMLYGIAMVEIEIDQAGQVVDANIYRKPAAPEVGPWVLAMLRRAAPFPAPVKFAGPTIKFSETFLVDKSGLFQVDSLTEGQR